MHANHYKTAIVAVSRADHMNKASGPTKCFWCTVCKTKVCDDYNIIEKKKNMHIYIYI